MRKECKGGLIRGWLSLAAGLLLAGGAPVAQAQITLIPEGSAWYYWDLPDMPPGEWWSDFYPEEEEWYQGSGQFGYGDFDETTVLWFGFSDEDKTPTAYFRNTFQLLNPGNLSALTVRMVVDDGAVLYLNGVEVVRFNMPEGPVSHGTYAAARRVYPQESEWITVVLPTALLKAGANTLVAAVHQYEPASPDLSFDLELTGEGNFPPTLVRGPYLQNGTPERVTVRWRTDRPHQGVVRFGEVAGAADRQVTEAVPTTEHAVELTGLSPGTVYYYSVGTAADELAGGVDYRFRTAPPVGSRGRTRIWAIGDFGWAGVGFATGQRAVRDAYERLPGFEDTDVWLMLGDNAYSSGTDPQYQAAVFDMYPRLCRRTVSWPTFGNHDNGAASSGTQSGVYYDIFNLPAAGEAGGVASGTEAYYSFDYANIHFICLNSQDVSRATNAPMMTWLRQDLAQTSQDWIIAYWHHPPYSKGSHDSDFESNLVEMRRNYLPVLEAGGVDLVLGGHSHCYERSYLLNGHYGFSGTLNPSMIMNDGDGRADGDGPYTKFATAFGGNRGAVYVVAGSGGIVSGGALNHPAHHISRNLLGSLVLDVDDQQLHARFLRETGAVDDEFTIVKTLPAGEPRLRIARREGAEGAAIELRWANLPGVRLEAIADPRDAGGWRAVPTPRSSGRTNLVVLPAGSSGAQLFRLHRPAP